MKTVTLVIVPMKGYDAFRVMLDTKLLWATRPLHAEHAAAYDRLDAWAKRSGYRVVDADGTIIADGTPAQPIAAARTGRH